MSSAAATSCNRCGQPVAAGTRYCGNCGADVSAEQSNAATRRFTPISTTIAQANELMARLRRAALGEYEILAELGRGGMASVFLAHDIQLDRKVAIKVMLPQLVEGEGMAERFKLEARTAAALSHANIIPIYAVRDTDQMVFFVMKFVEGRPLDTILREVGKAPLPMVRSIISKVGDALGYAHRRGVVHRDIKPANLMIDTEGQPVVTDFGIAKVAASAGLTMTGATIGTPAYMSPEQASSGVITGASDQYSLGIVAYQMLTGHMPFQAESLVSLMYMHCHEPAPPFMDERPETPRELHDAVMKMLAKKPEDRFPDLETAIEAIGRVHLSTSDPVQTQLMDLAKRGGNRAILDQVRTPVSPVVTRSKRTAAMATDIANAPTTPSGGVRGATHGAGAAPQMTSQPQTIVVQQSAAPWIITVAVVILAAVGIIAFVLKQQKGAPDANIATQPGLENPVGDARDGTQLGGAARPNVPTDSVSGTPGGAPAGGSAQPGAQPGTQSSTRPNAPANPPANVPANVPANTPTKSPANAPVTAPAVEPEPTRVTALAVSPNSRTLDVGASATFTADVTTNDGRAPIEPVVWRSTAPGIASVSVNGTVTAVAPGTAVIHASANGIDATATVRVNEPAPVAPARNAREEIAAAVDQYVRALESRQISEIKRAYVGITAEQEQQLTGALRAMEQLDVTLGINSLDIRGTTATAAVSGTYDFFNRDSRRRDRLPVNVQMTLEQGASGWLIRQIRSVR